LITGGRLKLTVLNPTFIVGPLLINEQGSSVKVRQAIENEAKKFYNLQIVSDLLNGLTEQQQRYQARFKHFAYVDVRDVALAHLRAMTNTASDGERIILFSKAYWQHEAAQFIEKVFHPMGKTFVSVNL
jgi:hypothetical protein